MSTDGQRTIRELAPSDWPALARIHAEIGAYYAALAPEHFHVPAAPPPATPAAGELWLVAEIGGEVAAVVLARLLEPAADAETEVAADLGRRRLRLEYLATAEKHRRRGLATALVDAAEAWGREHGATVAETTTFAGSPLSRPFWERRMGYAVRSVNLRKPL